MSSNTLAADVAAQFEDHLSMDEQTVQEDIDELQSQFGLPEDELRRLLENKYAKQAGIEKGEVPAPPSAQAVDEDDFDQVALETIDTDGERVDLLVEIDQLWDPTSGAIGQVGLVADGSARVKFTKWADSRHREYNEGDTLQIQDAVVDEWEGDYSIELRSSTNIEVVDENIDTESQSDARTVSGLIVDIGNGSGLIERCPHDDCSRVLKNDRCSEHGDVDGEDDLRIKAVLDDGTQTIDLIFNKEATADRTGITLDDALEMARDAMDRSVVSDEIEDQLVGRYLEVTGSEYKGYQLVDESTVLEAISEDRQNELDALLDEIKADHQSIDTKADANGEASAPA